jgi:integrase/recombinase XerC
VHRHRHRPAGPRTGEDACVPVERAAGRSGRAPSRPLTTITTPGGGVHSSGVRHWAGRRAARWPCADTDLSSLHVELLDAFRAYEHAVDGLAPPTVANHRTYLEALRWWERERPGSPLGEATTADLACFLVAEAARGLSPRTRRAEVAALRRWWSWLVLTGAADLDAAAGLRTPRVGAPHNGVYTAPEVAAILTHTATLDDLRGRQRHAVVATLRWTGMRSAELRTLHRRDLDLVGGQARVVGKGHRERTVLLPPPLVEVLERFIADVRPRLPDSPLLLANAHPFVTTGQHGFGQEALAARGRAGRPGRRVAGRHHPHTWRHTYATELVRAGVDIHVVQRLLGPASIASTVGYTHLVLDDLRDAVSSCGEAWDKVGRTQDFDRSM